MRRIPNETVVPIVLFKHLQFIDLNSLKYSQFVQPINFSFNCFIQLELRHDVIPVTIVTCQQFVYRDGFVLNSPNVQFVQKQFLAPKKVETETLR